MNGIACRQCPCAWNTKVYWIIICIVHNKPNLKRAHCCGADIFEKGPMGFLDAYRMFRSGNIWSAVKMVAEGAINIFLPAQKLIQLQPILIRITIDYLLQCL